MKRHAISTTMSVLIFAILLPVVVFSQADPGVTGAGAGVFPSDASLGGVRLKGLTFGMGVFIEIGGSAVGEFQATLAGTSVSGQLQSIEVQGVATSGSTGANGYGTFSGVAAVDMGNGTPPLTNVPFTVSASSTKLLLVIGTTNLPAASLTEGNITVR